MPHGDRNLTPQMRRWCDRVKAKADHHRTARHEEPNAMVMSQDDYLDVCAALGMLVKEVHGLRILVRWGMSACLSK